MQRTHTVFFDWNLPLISQIVQRLISYANGRFVDLSNIQVIVPTVQSGRRLREALAAESNGLFPPEISTPDGLLTRALQQETIADETTVAAAWVAVFRSLDFTSFKALFPATVEPTIAWRYSMARRFTKLRNELGEEGLDLQQVARFTDKSGHEPDRWKALAKLETLYLQQLKTALF